MGCKGSKVRILSLRPNYRSVSSIKPCHRRAFLLSKNRLCATSLRSLMPFSFTEGAVGPLATSLSPVHGSSFRADPGRGACIVTPCGLCPQPARPSPMDGLPRVAGNLRAGAGRLIAMEVLAVTVHAFSAMKKHLSPSPEPPAGPSGVSSTVTPRAARSRAATRLAVCAQALALSVACFVLGLPLLALSLCILSVWFRMVFDSSACGFGSLRACGARPQEGRACRSGAGAATRGACGAWLLVRGEASAWWTGSGEPRDPCPHGGTFMAVHAGRRTAIALHQTCMGFLAPSKGKLDESQGDDDKRIYSEGVPPSVLMWRQLNH